MARAMHERRNDITAAEPTTFAMRSVSRRGDCLARVAYAVVIQIFLAAPAFGQASTAGSGLIESVP